jgi:phage recombination protein Bet
MDDRTLAIRPPNGSTQLEATTDTFASWERGLEAKKELLRRTIAKDTTDDEFELFLMRCKQTRLDPFIGQICTVMRRNKKENRDVMTIQVTIHGLRLIADRTGNYAPGRPSTYEYDDNGRLVSATAYVMKYARGQWHEVAEVAMWDEFVQTYTWSGEEKLSGLWASKPHIMLSKCAEALALRKAFPAEMGNLYTDDELASDPVPPMVDVTPAVSRPQAPVQLAPASGGSVPPSKSAPVKYQIVELNTKARKKLADSLNGWRRSKGLSAEEMQGLIDAATGFKGTNTESLSTDEIQALHDTLIKLRDRQAIADFYDRQTQKHPAADEQTGEILAGVGTDPQLPAQDEDVDFFADLPDRPNLGGE